MMARRTAPSSISKWFLRLPNAWIYRVPVLPLHDSYLRLSSSLSSLLLLAIVQPLFFQKNPTPAQTPLYTSPSTTALVQRHQCNAGKDLCTRVVKDLSTQVGCRIGNSRKSSSSTRQTIEFTKLSRG